MGDLVVSVLYFVLYLTTFLWIWTNEISYGTKLLFFPPSGGLSTPEIELITTRKAKSLMAGNSILLG